MGPVFARPLVRKNETPAPQKTPAGPSNDTARSQVPAPAAESSWIDAAETSLSDEMDAGAGQSGDHERMDSEVRGPANLGSRHLDLQNSGGKNEMSHDGPEGGHQTNMPTLDGDPHGTKFGYEMKGGKLTGSAASSYGEPGKQITNRSRVNLGDGGPSISQERSVQNGDVTNSNQVSIGPGGAGYANRQDTEVRNEAGDVERVDSKTTSGQIGSDYVQLDQHRGTQLANGTEAEFGAGFRLKGGQETGDIDRHTAEAVDANGRGVQRYAGGRVNLSVGISNGAFGLNGGAYGEFQATTGVFSTDPRYAGMSERQFNAEMAEARGGVTGPVSLGGMNPDNLEAGQGYSLQTSTAYGGEAAITVYGFTGGIKGGRHANQRTTMHKRDNGDVMVDLKTTEGGYVGGSAGAMGGLIEGEVTNSGEKAAQARMVFTNDEKGMGREALQEFQRTGVMPGAVPKGHKDHGEYTRISNALRAGEAVSIKDRLALATIARDANGAMLKPGEASEQELPTGIPGVRYEMLRDSMSDTTTSEAKVLGQTVGTNVQEETQERTRRLPVETERITPTDDLTQSVLETDRTTRSGKESSRVHVDPKGPVRLKMETDVDARPSTVRRAHDIQGTLPETQQWHDRYWKDTHTMRGEITGKHVQSMLNGDTNQKPIEKLSEHYRTLQTRLDTLEGNATRDVDDFSQQQRAEIVTDSVAMNRAMEKWMAQRKIDPEEFQRDMQLASYQMAEYKKKKAAGDRVHEPYLPRSTAMFRMDFAGMMPNGLDLDTMKGEQSEQNWMLQQRYEKMTQAAMMQNTRDPSNPLNQAPKTPLGIQLLANERRDMQYELIRNPKLGEALLRAVPKNHQDAAIEEFKAMQGISAEKQRAMAPANLREMAGVRNAEQLYLLGQTNPRAAMHLVNQNSRGEDRIYAALALPARYSNHIIQQTTKNMDREEIARAYMGVVENALDSDEIDTETRRQWQRSFHVHFND